MGLTSEAEAIEISDGNANADEATLKHNASVIGKSSFWLLFCSYIWQYPWSVKCFFDIGQVFGNFLL